MAELFLLGFQIFFGVRAGLDFAGHALDDFDAGPFESLDLLRIVREKAHLAYAERLENLARQGEVALVSLEAETFVRFDRVEAGILQLIGLQLRHEADASALLLLVNQDASAFVSDHRQRHLELLAAVAAQGMKNVAGQALRVNPHKRRSGVNVAHHQGDGFFNRATSIGFSAKSIDAEPAPARGKIRGGYGLNGLGSHELIIAAGARGESSHYPKYAPIAMRINRAP